MKIVESKRKSKYSEAKEFFFENYDPSKKINKLATAESLGVSRQSIYNWIRELRGL